MRDSVTKPVRAVPRALIALFSLISLFGANWTHPGLAQSPSPEGTIRVGLVIYSSGATQTQCLTLPRGATGIDVLRASKLDLNIMAGPLGAAVCRMNNLGCTYPADACFCRCQGARCSYWAYYFLIPGQESGGWQYSAAGAGSRELLDGALEGWLWSDGSDATPTTILQPISFDAICNAPVSSATSVPATASATQNTGSAPDTSTLLGYIVLGIAVLGIGVFAAWRRRQKV